MSRTTKFNDLQFILLAAAAQRVDGNLFPAPDSVGEQAARIRKVIPPLLKRHFVAEADVTQQSRSWRQDGERFIGVAITDAGRRIIAADEQDAPSAQVADQQIGGSDITEAHSTDKAKRQTKADEVLAMLRRADGATLADLIAATGWLPHTTRAALTGLRKKGHVLDKGKRGDATCYSIKAAA